MSNLDYSIKCNSTKMNYFKIKQDYLALTFVEMSELDPVYCCYLYDSINNLNPELMRFLKENIAEIRDRAGIVKKESYEYWSKKERR